MADYTNQPTTDITNQGNRPGDGPLRPGGQGSPTPLSNPANLPSTQSAAVLKQQRSLVIVRDLAEGPERVRAAGIRYLPKEPGEDPANYNDRLLRSVFFNVFGHTIKGLVGQVFRRDPVLGDDVPAAIKTHAENIDLAGTHLDVFARDLLQDDLTAGHCAILVDFPNTGGQQNPRQESTGEIRPYWVPILKDNIVSWRTANEQGHVVLTQLVLKETTMVADGLFGEKEQTQYRVFYRRAATDVTAAAVGFQVLQINADKSVSIVDDGLYPTQNEIPVAEIISSGRKGLFESDPPLIDLAYLNIAHYQQWSDYATSIHKTCVPIFATIGIEPMLDGAGQPIILGPNTALNLPVGGDAKYISHNGASLKSIKEALDDLKSDMGTLGLSMLSPQKRTAETAQAKRLDKSTEDSALAVTARGLQDGLERALGFHARYLKLDSGGSISINKEFDEQQMAADMLTAWTNAVANAGIPERLMLEAMQIGELIDADENVDDIAEEMAANRAAAEAKKAAEAADQLAMANKSDKPNGNKTVPMQTAA